MTDELNEALAFARGEVKRNASLQYDNDRYRNRDKRNFEVVRRLRETMVANGYRKGSYLGVRAPDNGYEEVGDSKYMAALEIAEEFIAHLLKRMADK